MEVKNVYQRLIKVQGELKATKDLRNSYGNYNYRSAESILEAVKPLLQANGLVLTLTDSVSVLEGEHYVKATATVINIDNPTEKVEVNAWAREDMVKKGMDNPQATGACSSYARKYALNGLFCIDDNKDSDSTNQCKKGEKTYQQQVASATFEEQVEYLKLKEKELTALAESKGKAYVADYEDVENVKKMFNYAKKTFKD